MEKGDKVRITTLREPFNYNTYIVKDLYIVKGRIFVCMGDKCHHVKEKDLERILL